MVVRSPCERFFRSRRADHSEATRYTGGMATLHLDPLPRNATAGEVLRFVCDAAAIDGKLVGKITFQPRGATVELPDSHAAKAVAALDGAAFRERRVRARLATPPRSDTPHADHFAKLARLLDLEAEEERRRL